MLTTEIKNLESMIAKCHTIGGAVLLDYSDYLNDQLCKMKLANNQEPTPSEYAARRRFYAKYDRI